MQQHCLICRRTAPDANLYCEQSYCPGELSPLILEQGEHIADIEIVRPVTILRSGVVYAGVRQGEPVYVKVAHQGAGHKERLKREAELYAVAQVKKVTAPFLPTLLPVNLQKTGKQETYGKTMLAGRLVYYYVFAYVEAESLRNLLCKQPQLWTAHIGWIAIGVATAVAYLHRRRLFHFGLTPESVLVHFDAEPPNVPRILLVDLGICSPGDKLAESWYTDFLPPAYTAPELIDERRRLPKNSGQQIPPNAQIDVYGLGMLLYEMLIGAPPIPDRLRGDEALYALAVRGPQLPMDRVDDVRPIAELARQCTDIQMNKRLPDPAAFGQQLMAFFGALPEEPKKSRRPSQRTVYLVAGAVLTVVFLLVLAFSMTQGLFS
jgi:serine/threonine protein kinase